MSRLISIQQKLSRHILCIPGRRIRKKVIVIESDDWGSIRMPSREAFEWLRGRSIDVESNPMNRFDCLESDEDFEKTFDALRSIRDAKGNRPVITTNFVMANPDFDRIRNDGYETYYFEPFQTTYERYWRGRAVMKLLRDGISERLLFPQFHGREHINVAEWMKLLQVAHPEMRAAFDAGTFGIDVKQGFRRTNLMATLDYVTPEESEKTLNSLSEGYAMFKHVFGYPSYSFIAPCYVWDEAVEQRSSRLGVRFIQSALVQNIPNGAKQTYKKKYRLIGERNSFGQTYLVRNVYFEPSTNPRYRWAENCLGKIEAAFFWNKPVVISMHRVNFAGSILQDNRTNNLEQLGWLLREILKRWPDVEFMNSVQLGNLLAEKSEN